MKYIGIFILLTILPVALFPGKEDIYDRYFARDINSLEKNSGIIIPIGYQINESGFFMVKIKSLAGKPQFSATLGLKNAGDHTFDLPLKESQPAGFYHLDFLCNGSIASSKIIFLPDGSNAKATF